MEHPITRASINLTRACNLACSYCFTNGCTSGDMSLDMAKRAVDFLVDNAKKLNGQERMIEISFWGGEPLLKWSLLQDIVLYAEEKGAQDAVPVSFGGTTNGVLLTPEKFDFLDKHKCMFLVSFDGTPETHNYYRKTKQGLGSHKVIAQNMEKVLKRWPHYRPRMGPFAERIDHFFEDVKYLFDFGFNYIIFSPVYESGWTEEKWKIFEEQCYKAIDYMAELKAKGRRVEIEHFKSYTGKDDSRWPCGAGRFYVGIDIDGAIYPCHRFNKFNDERPWQEKEVCIGHIDCGITRPEFRDRFINWKPLCQDAECFSGTICHGGCYAANHDFNGNIEWPACGICRYVEMQRRVSEYYKEKVGMEQQGENNRSCICHNMCYAEGTPEEIRTIDNSTDATCICNLTNYTGPIDENIARPLATEEKSVQAKFDELMSKDRQVLRAIIMDIDRRLKALEEKVK